MQKLLLMLALNVLLLGGLWLGVTVGSSDAKAREMCYKQGVDSLPQGLDQTFLKTKSDYSKCLSEAK